MTKKIETVVVVGLGYIGLPTAAIIASHGIKIIGIDINQKIIATINQGKIHIIEPELDAIVDSVVHKGLLTAQMTPAEADVFIIAVPTPFGKNHDPDLSHVIAAIDAIAPYLKKGNTIILESTSPVGTTEMISKKLTNLRKDLQFPHNNQLPDVFIAYCPERVLPGRILEELVNNDRIIGGITKECSQQAKNLYQTFVKGACIITNVRTAEMCKLTENSFRDINIAFANELSILCDKLNINVWELIQLANRHPRVNILQPGCGVGGHCIAVDPWFIAAKDKANAKLITTARAVNDNKPLWVIDKVKTAVNKISYKTGKKTNDVKVACLGLAFKPNIDDLRESPALFITRRLITEGINTLVVEPNLESFNEFNLVMTETAIQESDIILLLVAHKEFKDISLKNKVVIDLCGIRN